MVPEQGARTDGTMRLFLAVEVPDEGILAVADAIGPWREAFPDARWVPSRNWHVTMKFLGSTAGDRVSGVEQTVAGIVADHRPGPVSVHGLGAFPSTQRARVLWAGLDDPAAGLDALVTDLEAGLADRFRKEMRRFHPHLTVARSEPPIRLPDAYAATPLASEPFTVDRVVLFRSRMKDGATTYDPLASFPFGG